MINLSLSALKQQSFVSFHCCGLAIWSGPSGLLVFRGLLGSLSHGEGWHWLAPSHVWPLCVCNRGRCASISQTSSGFFTWRQQNRVRPHCTSTCQVSAFVMFADVLLTEVCHRAKTRARQVEIHLPPLNGRSCKVTL